MQNTIREALVTNGINVDDVELQGPLSYVKQVSANSFCDQVISNSSRARCKTAICSCKGGVL